MFCTNCGEEMRATDKFCASCGTAAAPRPAKPRAAAPSATEPSAPAPPPQSTAQSFRAPLPTAQAPLSRQQEQQVLLEAEEIASVRGMVPAEALPPEFPPQVAETRTCGFCGEPNPSGNQFCERCGQRLQPGSTVQSAQPPAPATHSAWLDVPEPPRKPVATPAKTPAAAKAATAAAPAVAAGKDDEFFYFYDDKTPQRSNLKLLIVLMVVLALGVLGVIYLMSRPSGKSPVVGNVTITISPTEAEVPVGEAHDFSATVTGSGDTDVTWSVAEGSAGGNVVNRGAQAQGGAVASLGVYVAPNMPGTYHVVAASKADPSKSATAEVLVSGK